MQTEGPQLESLVHRLTELPVEFLTVSEKQGGTDILAIVCDLIRFIGPSPAPETQTATITTIRHLPVAQWPLISVVCWLLHDDWFHQQPQLVPAIWKLLTSERLMQLTKLVPAHRFVEDADRREELVRLCLAALELRPQGESAAVAADRMAQVDCVERDRVLRATAAAERRAREIREAMVRKQALESASRYGE